MKERWTQELDDFVRSCESERRIPPMTCSGNTLTGTSAERAFRVGPCP
jgi:hypothetical protein